MTNKIKNIFISSVKIELSTIKLHRLVEIRISLKVYVRGSQIRLGLFQSYHLNCIVTSLCLNFKVNMKWEYDG